jgi:hypothetical protein
MARTPGNDHDALGTTFDSLALAQGTRPCLERREAGDDDEQGDDGSGFHERPQN